MLSMIAALFQTLPELPNSIKPSANSPEVDSGELRTCLLWSEVSSSKKYAVSLSANFILWIFAVPVRIDNHLSVTSFSGPAAHTTECSLCGDLKHSCSVVRRRFRRFASAQAPFTSAHAPWGETG